MYNLKVGFNRFNYSAISTTQLFPLFAVLYRDCILHSVCYAQTQTQTHGSSPADDAVPELSDLGYYLI